MTFGSTQFFATLLAAALLAACAPPSSNEPASESRRSEAAKPASAAPSVETLLALERQATEAYIKGDTSYFEKILSDKLVMQVGGSRLSKVDVIKMVSEVPCQIQDGWTFTEPRLSKIDGDTFALTYKATKDGSCTADGKTEKLPSPVRASTVWARVGESWQTVFHGEIPIFDPASAPSPRSDEKKIPMPPPMPNAPPAQVSAKRVSDPVSDGLMAAERALWGAWMKHDAEAIDRLVADEIAFVNLFGNYFPDKTASVSDWTSDACEVSSFMLANGVGTSISPTVGIVTLTGTVYGTCGGQDISGQKIYATTVYVKNGDTWKWAFGFNSPK